MASANLSPRQKMINLMYLVLTAMLALNVSAEVLRAFTQIRNSLKVTNNSIADKNDDMYAAFQEEASKNVKAEENFEKAKEIRTECSKLLTLIDDIRTVMVGKYSGNENGVVDEDDYETISELAMLKDRGNIDIASLVLVEQHDDRKWGDDLENAIKSARTKILAALPEDADPGVVLIPEPIGQKAGAGVAAKTWLQQQFGDMPLTGALTQLTKLESDVRNTETEIFNLLMADVSKRDYKFSSLTAKVIAKSSYVLTGQDYEADILLVAYDEKQTFPISINDQDVPVEGGMGKYKVRASSPGVKKYKGAIKVLDPATGKDTLYEFEADYTVARPAAVVSPTKMNVFYIGVPNPVSVSSPGIAASNLRVGITGGGNSSITKDAGDGNYIVKVSAPGKSDVRVSASVDGSTVNMGTSEFRVKFIPDPLPTVGGIKLSSVPSNQFSAQRGVIALLDNFDFDVRYIVKGFRLIYLQPRKDPKVSRVGAPTFNAEMLGWVRSCSPGDRFVVDEIKVQGPDGRARTLPSATYAIR